MSPERRTQFGIFWKDETLGVTEEGVYAQNAHFDIKPVRVRTRWGQTGWLVGYGTVITTMPGGQTVGDTDRFVLLDGRKTATPYHVNSIKRI